MTERDFSYEPIADEYAALIDNAPYNALYERPAMLAALPPVDGRHILDAGCGAGWYTEQLLARSARVTAIDQSPSLVEQTRGRIAALGGDAAARVDARVADLRDPLPFLADGSVDGIVSALALDYVGDWTPTFAEFRRVLAPGEWLLFSTLHPGADAARLEEGESYFDVVRREETWGRHPGFVFLRYRRPLSAISDALVDAGFGIARIVEPRPTEAFRAAKPRRAEALMRQPEFILILARPW